ncbi:hypothetical protein GCM10022243_17770 [Saccharothrix violaceirubra]|uniref:DUF397 domain-containing protein n=1 Tax=Saccharothrix violaceirubra TaxID=413306 RepID=A0A7W7T0N2_9PSEU|nr:DUF397 domain-containing protein [Saccharothrix violaceirubra]MBB4964432.1 hypothetical protein [Saccharothrix violaceirubra]
MRWRKSTRSSNVANCVELATTPDALLVRDSKRPDGPVLAFPRAALAPFLRTARGGRPDFTVRSGLQV